MPRYRYRTTAIVGPWRERPEKAIEDAVKVQLVTLDSREPDGCRWLVRGQIEEDSEGQARAL